MKKTCTINYRLLEKKENDKGVFLTFEKTEQSPRGWLDRVRNFFGLGFFGKEETTQFDVFYPISENGIKFQTNMCFADGSNVPFRLAEQLVRLEEIALFKEKPSIELVAEPAELVSEKSK